MLIAPQTSLWSMLYCQQFALFGSLNTKDCSLQFGYKDGIFVTYPFAIIVANKMPTFVLLFRFH